MSIILDTNILGKICHPQKNIDVAAWFIEILMRSEIQVFLPEISDYELRRELLRLRSFKSLERLSQLGEQLVYVPISTSQMLVAAEFWAQDRQKGKPSAAMHALDGDVILAAQALSVGAVVITENTKHLSKYTEAINWSDFSS